MKRLALMSAVGALSLPAVAHATTIQTTDTSHPWQTWTNTAQVPTWRGDLPLTVAPGYFDCGGFTSAAGCTSITPAVDQTTGQILQGNATVSTELDAGQSSWDDRQTLYHELGQVFWAEYLTPADETRFMQITGLAGDSSDWGNWRFTRVINGVTVHFSPYEWFAEGYRYCAEYGVNQPPNVVDEEGTGYPGDKLSFASQQREVCQLIDQVGLDNGIVTPPQTMHLTGRVIRVRIRATRGHATAARWLNQPARLQQLRSVNRTIVH